MCDSVCEVSLEFVVCSIYVGPKVNTTKQYETYRYYKPTNRLNDQLYYKTHTL